MKKAFVIVLSDKLRKLDRYLIMKHIQSKSLRNNIDAKAFYDWLDKQENISLPNNVLFRFTTLKDGFSSLLSASAHQPNYIIASPEWASRLFLFDSEATRNAFSITLGHETTHTEGDFSTKGFHGKNKKFINWVNEVHADFGAAQKMVNSNKEKLLESIDYKINTKKPKKNILLILLEKLVLHFINESTHPSWKQRRAYAETGAFNRKLIEKIASHIGCVDKNLIIDVVNHYKEIVLKD